MSATEETNTQSSEQLVKKAEVFLAGVLDRMGVEAEIHVSEEDDKFILDVDCDDVDRIIGRRGQVVDALQHLVGKVVAKERSGRSKPIIVDAGGYRDQHIERLESLAQRMSEKVLENKREVELKPMTPHDRRIVHMYLADITGVSTRSEGEGEGRHIIVEPAAEAAEAVSAE